MDCTWITKVFCVKSVFINAGVDVGLLPFAPFYSVLLWNRINRRWSLNPSSGLLAELDCSQVYLK